MTKHTYSVYIIENGGGRIHWTQGQAYCDCIAEVRFLKKYEGKQAIIIED